MKIIEQTKLTQMILWLALLLLFSLPNQALAVNAQLFRPLPDGMGVVTVHGANALEQGQSSFGIYFNYASEPLKFALTPNGEQVKWFFTSDVLLGVGLKDWLTLFADLPVSVSTLEDFPSGFDTNEVLFGDIS